MITRFKIFGGYAILAVLAFIGAFVYATVNFGIAAGRHLAKDFHVGVLEFVDTFLLLLATAEHRWLGQPGPACVQYSHWANRRTTASLLSLEERVDQLECRVYGPIDDEDDESFEETADEELGEPVGSLSDDGPTATRVSDYW